MNKQQELAIREPCRVSHEMTLAKFCTIRGPYSYILTVNLWQYDALFAGGAPCWHSSVARVVHGTLRQTGELSPRFIAKLGAKARRMIADVGEGRIVIERTARGCHARRQMTAAEVAQLGAEKCKK